MWITIGNHQYLWDGRRVTYTPPVGPDETIGWAGTEQAAYDCARNHARRLDAGGIAPRKT